jgi:hypothetical protein
MIDNDLAALFEETPEEIVANGRTVEVNGQCYSVTAYDTTCYSVQTVTIDNTYPSCGDCGCFKLTACEGDPPEEIYARTAYGPTYQPIHLRDYVGKIIRLNTGVCYSVAESQDCETLTDIYVQEAYDSCELCTCYLLTDCDNPYNTMLTFSDLSAWGIGALVRQANTDPLRCWTITSTAAWDYSAVAFEVEDAYPDCDTCLNRRRYLLTPNCNLPECDEGGGGSGATLVTTEDLHAAVGLYVKVNGVCYQVADTYGGTITDPTLDYQGPFATCDDCLEADVDATQQIVTDIQIYGNAIIAKTKTMVIRAGRVVGFCDGADITLEGTDCSEGGM